MPVANDVVVMLGGGLTTTFDDMDLVESAAEVAVTVTVKEAETDVGALYVVPPVVLFVNVPHAVPVHVVPDMLQVTPLLLESFATVAVNARVCPWSMDVWAEGDRVTEIDGVLGPLLLLPPQPHKNNNPDKIKTTLFIVKLPPGTYRT